LRAAAVREGDAPGDAVELHVAEALDAGLADGLAALRPSRHRRHPRRRLVHGLERAALVAGRTGGAGQLGILEGGAAAVGHEDRAVPAHAAGRLVVDELVVGVPAEAER